MTKRVYDSVQEYYGKVLKKSGDLQTNACTTCGKPAPFIMDVISLIHKDVESKYYGCGLVVPHLLEGMKILDLGSGSGRDCFILSKLVGPSGHVIGVDMTKEQIDVANSYVDYHTKIFGFSKPNIEFRMGYMEKLKDLGLQDNSFDIIISNCVINLSPDKEAVLREAFRILKPGGELYFSDVYSDRRVPTSLVNHKVLYGECLSGALYWNDFIQLSKQVGFMDPRLVEDSPITINNKDIEALIGHIKFYSATYRLFKLSGLEPMCEDYGQAVVYKGTISTCPEVFKLDSHHIIQKGKMFLVCGNTYKMLKETRFAPHFEFYGNQNTHFGIFEGCGTGLPFGKSQSTRSDGGSCC